MGILSSIFSSKKEFPESWKELENVETLDQIISDSNDRPVVIYKHSTTCSLNSVKINELKNDWSQLNKTEKFDFYYLDLLEYRSISNEIEDRFEIRHQSPQLLVIKNGSVTDHTSHLGVTVDFLNSALTAPH